MECRSLRRLIDVPKTVSITSFPLARETEPSESVRPTSVAVHVPKPEKKLPVKLRLIVSARTEVVIREAKVRMQGPSVGGS